MVTSTKGQVPQTILLVEDEDEVRSVMRDILVQAGYTVLEAREGAEALYVADWHEGPIHLMLTDVIMPHVSGGELVQRLGPLRSETKIICVSGHANDPIVRQGLLNSGLPFLPKPFSPEALTSLVREVLDRA